MERITENALIYREAEQRDAIMKQDMRFRLRMAAVHFPEQLSPLLGATINRVNPKLLAGGTEKSKPTEPAVALPPTRPRATWITVIHETAQRYQMRADDLQTAAIGGSRVTSAARQEAAWRMRHELKMSYSAIGRRLHRDHSSIIHAINKYQSKIDNEQSE